MRARRNVERYCCSLYVYLNDISFIRIGYKRHVAASFDTYRRPVNGQISHTEKRSGIRNLTPVYKRLKDSDLVSLHIILHIKIHAAFCIPVEAARFEIENKPCICFMKHRLSFIFVPGIDSDYHILRSVHAACISSVCFFVYRSCCIFMLILTSAFHPQVRSVFHTSVQNQNTVSDRTGRQPPVLKD